MKAKTLLLATALLAGAVLLPGCGRSESDVKDDCKPVVEQIFKKMGADGVKCKDIVNIKETGKDSYTAEAMLTDNSGAAMTVALKITYSDDSVLVELDE